MSNWIWPVSRENYHQVKSELIFNSWTEKVDLANRHIHCKYLTFESISKLFLHFLKTKLALNLPVSIGNSFTLLKAYSTDQYRSGTVNSNMVNSKFRLIRSYCEIFFYNFPNIPCLKCTVNLNFHLIRSKTLPMNDFELTVPDLYRYIDTFRFSLMTRFGRMLPVT